MTTADAATTMADGMADTVKMKNCIRVRLPLDLIQPGISSDVSDKGHHARGGREPMIRNFDDLEMAKPLIRRSLEKHDRVT